MREFNTSGPNRIHQHYTLLRKELVAEGKQMVYNDRYFTIWAPRQTGKSTYFGLLADELKKEGYKVCHVNIEAFATVEEDFLSQFLSKRMSEAYGYDFSGNTIDWVFEKLFAIKDEKWVFIVDEIEGLNPEIFNRFLHTIRSAYHSRSTHSLKSVILVGVSNITGIIQDNASPFNIADNLNIPYFTKDEIFELYAQHEAETGQIFADEVKEKIADITAGQPGLVNGFGLKLVKDAKNKPLMGYDDYLKAENWYVYEAIDKNISNIINKAKQHQKFIEQLLFTERKVLYNIDDERLRFMYVHGILKREEDGNITFWVPLYKKRLQQYFYPHMNGEAEQIQGNIWLESFYTADRKLNIDKIIREYQEYANRRGFRYFIEKDAEGKPKGLIEAALAYSFETYIQAFLIAVEGKSYLEPHVVLGRSDLIVNIAGTEFVIEAKIYYNLVRFLKGKKQLAYYIKSLGLNTGVYLIFVRNTITQPLVKEEVEIIEGVEITTYLVWYDVDKDF